MNIYNIYITMKRLVLIFVLLFSLFAIQAQEIVVTNSPFCEEWFYEKDCLKVYRPKKSDLFIRKYSSEIKLGEHWLGKFADKWALWVVDRIIPEKVLKTFLELPNKRMYNDDCFLMIYYDTTGQILAAEYMMNSLMRMKITDDQLNSIYSKLMKEKIRNPDYTSDVKKESFKSMNKLMKRSDEIFYTYIPLVKISKAVERMKKDEKAWRYVQSRMENLRRKETEVDNEK
jgi:hypothetical protein